MTGSSTYVQLCCISYPGKQTDFWKYDPTAKKWQARAVTDLLLMLKDPRNDVNGNGKGYNQHNSTTPNTQFTGCISHVLTAGKATGTQQGTYPVQYLSGNGQLLCLSHKSFGYRKTVVYC